MGVSVILFDLGNVVVDWQPRRLYRARIKDPQRLESFLSEVCTLAWHTAHDRGVPMDANIEARIADYPEFADDIRAWKTQWLDMFEGYVAGMPELIGRLESRRHPLFALTNLPAEKAEETFGAFPMLRVFRNVLVSGVVGVVKPDPAIYRLALDMMGCPPDEVLFIDDRADNTDAARAMGFQTHTFTDAGALERDLIAHGLL